MTRGHRAIRSSLFWILRLILCRDKGGISTLGSVRTGPDLFISGFTKKWRDLLSVLLSNHVVDNYQHLKYLGLS
jgi:hypothetical protein